MTLTNQLLSELRRDGDFVNGATLERMVFKSKKGAYKPATVSRTLRKLAETDDRVENRYEPSVAYRYILNKYELHEMARRNN